MSENKSIKECVTSLESTLVKGKTLLQDYDIDVADIDGYSTLISTIDDSITDEITFTSNNTYVAPGLGYKTVIVNVPSTVIDKNIVKNNTPLTENKTYSVPQGVDGWSQVTVNVPQTTNNVDNQALDISYSADNNKTEWAASDLSNGKTGFLPVTIEWPTIKETEKVYISEYLSIDQSGQSITIPLDPETYDAVKNIEVIVGQIDDLDINLSNHQPGSTYTFTPADNDLMCFKNVSINVPQRLNCDFTDIVDNTVTASDNFNYLYLDSWGHGRGNICCEYDSARKSMGLELEFNSYGVSLLKGRELTATVSVITTEGGFISISCGVVINPEGSSLIYILDNLENYDDSTFKYVLYTLNVGGSTN